MLTLLIVISMNRRTPWSMTAADFGLVDMVLASFSKPAAFVETVSHAYSRKREAPSRRAVDLLSAASWYSAAKERNGCGSAGCSAQSCVCVSSSMVQIPFESICRSRSSELVNTELLLRQPRCDACL